MLYTKVEQSGTNRNPCYTFHFDKEIMDDLNDNELKDIAFQYTWLFDEEFKIDRTNNTMQYSGWID